MSYIEENNIEIAFFQETWLNRGDKNIYRSIQEYGYQTISFERKESQGGVWPLSIKRT